MFRTVQNEYARFFKKREEIKGQMPNFMDPGYYDTDNIHTEDVDFLCKEMGEWYREYREENLKVWHTPAFLDLTQLVLRTARLDVPFQEMSRTWPAACTQAAGTCEI
jgi:hypothetical protein